MIAALILLASLATAPGPASDSRRVDMSGVDAFKIFVVDTGAYQIGFDDLVAAGLELDSLPSDRLQLSHQGSSVPLWVDDGGDGRFGPGDHFEFVGHHLAGATSYYFEYSPYNVYRLSTDCEAPLRLTSGRRLDTSHPSGAMEQALFTDEHHEQDVLRVRLPSADDGEEFWFWDRVVGGYPAFTYELDLPYLDSQSGGTVSLKVELRGWSRPRTKGSVDIADHHVDVAINGTRVASAIWDGEQSYLVDLPDLPVGLFQAGSNQLDLSSPKRQEADGDPLVDVVLLNWIELRTPRSGDVGGRQAKLTLSEPGTRRPTRLRSATGEDLLLFGDSGWRLAPDASTGDLLVEPSADDRTLIATPSSKLAQPVRVVGDVASDLRDVGRRFDYVMIAHPSLRDAIEPLAAFHRGRGLKVTVVDIYDVYDEFSYGVEDPAAIQTFLTYAHEQWTKPAPRFVLLVGDASWDARNELAIDSHYADWTSRPFELVRFTKNRSTKYGEDEPVGQDDTPRANDRNLIPTLTFFTRQGPAASDNGFVMAGDDAGLPQMAIGRLPVTTAEEVGTIVEKTIRHVLTSDATSGEADGGDQRMLFVSSEQRSYQAAADRVAEDAAAAGFEAIKIYPESQEASNEKTTSRLLEEVDAGALLVYFHGHGGRYIWRTGPRDLDRNHDLLTLDQLDQLQPRDRLPLVLSMSCYSAPFDHPSADSIGEKFLRLADRGAVAVVAASWRNSPRLVWSESLLHELLEPGATVGEALMRAKQQFAGSLFLHTYNLLGDPAVPAPAAPVPVVTDGAGHLAPQP